jgi:hypothetical protein
MDITAMHRVQHKGMETILRLVEAWAGNLVIVSFAKIGVLAQQM